MSNNSKRNQRGLISKIFQKIQGKIINVKFNATMTGDYMPNNGFTPKQLEQLSLLIKPINDHLDVIEQDIKVLKKDVKAINRHGH